MSSSNRLAYLAKIDMVAQARKVRSRRWLPILTALLLLVFQPGIPSMTGHAELHAAEKTSKAKAPARNKPEPVTGQEFITTDSPDELISTTEQMIEKLVLQIDRESEQHGQSKPARGNAKSIIASLPSIKPIDGFISSQFGMREHPIYKRPIFHAGTDFSAPVGTKVIATADGTVAFSGFDKGYGKKVVIEHGNGYQTIYAHLSKAVIRQGQHIRRGDIIAFSGNSGLSTGPHLHYEIRKDNAVVNPTAFFLDDLSPDKFMTLHEDVQDQDNSNS
jgi:murein DD-endopeptidase MepM/ murein hydrolase activator NlpD